MRQDLIEKEKKVERRKGGRLRERYRRWRKI